MPRYPGGLIRKTPVTPTGPLQDGTAPGVWTLAEATYWTKQGLWPIAGNAYTDPNFENVTLLLPGNGTNGAQNNTFLDSSTNNFTVTRNGDTTQGSFSPYSDLWSNYFDGAGDYITAPNNTAFDFGSGNFTIEFWLNPISATTGWLMGKGDAASAAGSMFSFYLAGTWDFYYGGSALALTRPTLVANTWQHIAVVRNGTTITIYKDGVAVSSGSIGSNSLNTGGSYPFQVGYYAAAGYNGYISNLRVVKGTAVYTSAFTPPTAPLTAISGTSLLTCQSNRFRDASSNNFAITVNGDTSVSNFAPFNPTAPYSPTTNGGSGYFDGSGDYLTASTSYTLSGDFTVECWVYATGNANQGVIQLGGDLSSTSYPISIAMYPNGEFQWGYQTSYTSTTGGKFPIKTWIHIALVRNAGVTRLYLNGVDTGSTLNVSTSYSISSVFIGTYYSSSYPFNGYISNVRVVNGTAVYTSNFTPPTAPVTAITNTSLLLNFTNAGIVDASAKNDLITVGNAQISTAQSVFGGGSIYFDGSGDYLSIPNSANLQFGSGNFTIEFWLYVANTTGNKQIINTDGPTSGVNTSYAILASGSSLLYYLSSNGTNWNVASGVSIGSISANTWYHVALVRNGNTITPYLNGVAGATTTSSAALYNFTSAPNIGQFNNTDYLNGYIDDLRITKGVARYTSNFTPPTKAFPVQ